MSQISLRYLNPKTEQQIFDTFVESFTTLSSPQKATDFLYDLLSQVEQVMLGKRLAIAYMLMKGYSQRSIADTLKVSQPTVTKVNASLKIGSGYRAIITHMLQKEKVVAFFDSLEEKLDHLLPPKGANWSEHYKRTNAERAKRKKAF
ncbi:helix-turn-helix domain-containing protein [Candidatus Woesebacteria bacterium]|nr:helix-turn-helix domain-containing protein [Candidatus Woesebacteria bacterium]